MSVVTLVKMARDLAAAFRSGARATATFAAGFLSTFVESGTVDEWVQAYSDAWDAMKADAGTAGERKALREASEASGNDPATAAHRSWIKADAANKTLTKLKVYKSELTGLLALVREVDRKLAWEDISVDEWADTRSTAGLAGSVENIKNYVKFGGTPDAPNTAPTSNRTPSTPVEVDDLEAAIALMITEQIDAVCAEAAIKALAPILLGGRERVAHKA